MSLEHSFLNFSIFKKVLRQIQSNDVEKVYYQLRQVNKYSKKYCDQNFQKPTIKNWLIHNFSNLLTIEQCIPSLTISKIYSSTFRSEKMRYIETYGFFKLIFDGEGTLDVIKHCLNCVKLHRGDWYYYEDIWYGQLFVKSRFSKNYDYDRKRVWFDALMVSIEYDRFDLTKEICERCFHYLSKHQLKQFYHRCLIFGRLDLISLIPIDQKFIVDWLLTLSNAKNESIYHQLMQLCPIEFSELMVKAQKCHFNFAKHNQLFELQSILMKQLKYTFDQF